MRILVTGADGFLGANTVRHLLAVGYRVRAFLEAQSASATLEGLPIERAWGDITSFPDVHGAMRGCDAVVHAAGSTATWPNRSPMVHRVNVAGTRNVMEAALQMGIWRLVHVSSAAVFAPGTRELPGDESQRRSADEHKLGYTRSKAIAHELVAEAARTRGLPAAIVAPTFMFGPHDAKPTSGRVILAAFHGLLPGLPPGGRNFVSVKDVAVAIGLALHRDVVGEAFIAGGANLTYPELCNIIARVSGANVRVPPVLSPFAIRSVGMLGSATAALTRRPPKLTYHVARLAAADQFYSSRKAERLLGYRPSSVEEAVRSAFEWFRDNGYLEPARVRVGTATRTGTPVP
jgi:dihydroflavonol-4-reductase